MLQALQPVRQVNVLVGELGKSVLHRVFPLHTVRVIFQTRASDAGYVSTVEISTSTNVYDLILLLLIRDTNWRLFWSLNMKPPRILYGYSKKIEKSYKFSQK